MAGAWDCLSARLYGKLLLFSDLSWDIIWWRGGGSMHQC